jgi:hypothetical protein
MLTKGDPSACAPREDSVIQGRTDHFTSYRWNSTAVLWTSGAGLSGMCWTPMS